jgi:photosystem I subunit 11
MQPTTSQVRLSTAQKREAVHAANDPQFGDLATPINASNFVKVYLNNLPAFRWGLTPFQRGLEVGMAHGYWLIGPFVKLGPLRDTSIANLTGFLCTIVVVGVSTLAIWLYASSNPPAPTASNAPKEFTTADGWSGFASGFLIGGLGGAIVAWLVLVGIRLLG